MPIYEFRCPRCGRIEEVLCLEANWEIPACSHCNIPMRRIMSPFAYKADRTAQRERSIMKLATDYLKDGKVEDAARFLKKASEYVKTDNIKRASEALNRKVSGE